MRKQANLKQNQIGGPNKIDVDNQHRYGTSSSFRECAKDIQVIADDCANSPSAWIYKGGRKLQDLCRPFIGGSTVPKLTSKSDASVASWRKMAAKTILSGENMNSDDENDKAFDGVGRGAKLDDNNHSHLPFRSDSAKEGSITTTSKTLSNAGNPSMLPDEPRIVAPNVSKLSPRSVVEIRLQSMNECVAILCSVDVLKMRSSFFYDVLNEQEDGRSHTSGDQNDIWRDPLVIPEISPFEAAAFLESLHEGRAVFKGDWVYSWARLSVTWQIQDLVLEYAGQIDSHFQNLFNIIKNKNWRTNPNIWLGARVAVLRKGPTPAPTVVTGTIADATQTTGYSKLRVVFDSNDSRSSGPQKMGNISNIQTYASASDMFGLHTPSRSPAGNCNISNNFPVTAFTPRMNSSPRLFCPHTPGAPAQSSSAAGKGPGPGIGSGFSGGVTGGVGSVQPSGVVGDVGEPLWVQLSHPSGAQTKSEAIGTPHPLTLWDNSTLKGVECNKDWSVTQGYSCWSDPDDLSMAELKKFISEADKRMFWEMAKAIIELPEISHFSNSSIKNAKDLAMILKKPEYKILWTAVAADILPRQAAAELVTAAYVEI